MVLLHHGQSVTHGLAALDGDRVVDHAVFGAFHGVDLTGLLGDGHVFVYDTDASFACDGYG